MVKNTLRICDPQVLNTRKNIFKVVLKVETFYLIGFVIEKIITLNRKYLLNKVQGLKKGGIIGLAIPILWKCHNISFMIAFYLFLVACINKEIKSFKF